MIIPGQGNLLQADADVLVNTVNCEGVMGKGIALQFKQAYPEMAKAYEKAASRGEIVPGRMQIWETGELRGPRYIINFPTKREWYKKSSYADIASGLDALIHEVRRLSIKSIAVPPLGCGNGGLAWRKVQPMIVNAFATLPQVRVILFAPVGAPATQERVIKTERPKLTLARALFIGAIDRYAVLAYQITQLEIQKLAYFLQEAGQPLRLKYAKERYGPYADNLNKVLETLEGHYIHGFDGDRAPEKEITIEEQAIFEADKFLDDQPDAKSRLERVANLIEGFETPYGMELLSSVHFVAAHEQPSATSADEAVRLIHDWNDRKKKLLRPEHIRKAWDHLKAQGWLA